MNNTKIAKDLLKIAREIEHIGILEVEKFLSDIDLDLYFYQLDGTGVEVKLIEKIKIKNTLSGRAFKTQNIAKVYLDKRKDEYVGEIVVECDWKVMQNGRGLLKEWEIGNPKKLFKKVIKKAEEMKYKN